MVFFSGWLLYIPQGQIQRLRWAITNPLDSPLERVSDTTAAKAAVALTKDDRWQVAFKLVAEHVNRSEDKADFLRQFAVVVPQQEDSNQARAKLNRALVEAKQIAEPGSQSYALRAIASASGELKDEKAAKEILLASLEAAEQIAKPGSQSYALSAIASAYGKLKDEKAAKEILLASLEAVEQIAEPGSQSNALSAIASASGELTNIKVTQAILHDTLSAAKTANASPALEAISIQYARHYAWGKALQALRNCRDSEKVTALAQVLTLWAEKKNPKLIDGAVVLTLEVKGTPGDYTFDVSLHSPDLGCNQYTDWWEVLSDDGELLYRHVFEKSHVDEQPFDSSGGPVKIQPDQVIFVRAHMHSTYTNFKGKDYGAMQAWKGMIIKGFKMIRLSRNFAAGVAKEEPQPPECHST